MKTLNYRIVGLFTFIIFSWGIAWPVNKVGLMYMTPLWYTAIRLIVGTMTMMLLVLLLNKFSLPKREDFKLILTIGLLQISIYILLANFGLSYLPAGRSSLIAYTTPLWIMPIAVLIFREEAALIRWIGFILGISGLIVLLCPWKMNWQDTNVVFGCSMLLLASLFWALSLLCVRYMKWSKSPLELIPWQLLIGTLPVLCLALIKEPNVTFVWNSTLVLSLVYNGILVTGLSYWTGVVITRELPTIMVSLGFLIVPVFSIIVSAFFMQEFIDGATGMAMVFIFLGLICVVV